MGILTKNILYKKKVLYCQYIGILVVFCALWLWFVGKKYIIFAYVSFRITVPAHVCAAFGVTKSIFKGILDSRPLKRAKADISLTQHSLSAILIMWCKLENHAIDSTQSKL